MKTISNKLTFAAANSNYTNRLSVSFKAGLILLASLIFGLTGAFAQSANCVKGNATANDIKYFVNGQQVAGLRGNVKQGSTVKVVFHTASGTSKTRFSLVSYKAPGPTFDANTADQQKVYEFETGMFEPGRHVMVINVPDCYFQVDFVKGCVINKLGPANSNNFYSKQNRLIDADNGGTNSCQMLGVDVKIDNPFQVSFPDSSVAHMAIFQNTSSSIKDRININLKSYHGWKVDLYDNSGTTLLGTDNEGDGSWEYVNNAFDKDNNGEPDTKKLNPGAEEEMMIIIHIAPDAIIGDLDTLEVRGFSGIDRNVKDMEMAFTEVDEPFVLPIELLYFSAKINVDHVKLEWATASELNNEYFTLERSKNGADFHGFEEIKGAGNSNKTLVYASKDVLPEGPVMYYRLKQTDFDGTTSYSKVVAVKGKNSELIALEGDVYPNPFNENFTVNFNAAEPGDVVATIIDIQGKVVSRNVIHASKGHNQFTFDEGSSLPRGMYFISLERNGAVINSKLSKTAGL
jgi:hypothetical protein